MKHLKYSHSFEVVAELPKPLEQLRTLAYNLRWSWHIETQELFAEIDRQLWEESKHNPIALIDSLTPERQKRLLDDPVFMARLEYCVRDLEQYLQHENWFDEKFPGKRDETHIAYFCAEFGIAECLPIYSGGLGILAGDHLKAASDLGVPLVGVGLLYARGYFRQFLNPDGWQQEHYPQYDFYGMPLKLVRNEDEQPLRVDIEFPDRIVTCNVWLAQVGRVPLYLLDSNVLENEQASRGITDTLYGGDQEMRLRQEIILGIGGMRALKAVGIKPTVCHLNEGHAAFVSLERFRQIIEAEGCDFRTARKASVSGSVFTTHTPVPAGFDVFPVELLERYLTSAAKAVGLSFDELTKLGRLEPENQSEPFNMAVMAMENANYVNGVSKLHAEVSREMFQRRWPEYPVNEVPIDSVTNGVHTMTWIGRRMTDLLDRHLGSAWRENSSDPNVWARIHDIPDNEIWELREDQRGDLIRFVRRRLSASAVSFQSPMQNPNTPILDPRILTVGFARRFATYKRAYLLLSDRDRLKSILFHSERPIQFVFAGKSHPQDDGGKGIIKDIVHFIRSEGGASRMVFLEDYDIEIARAMVQGVDVWLNTPRRPMEASGTSGMKVAPNGGLNCSVLDGWWAEGYKPGLGWAVGTVDRANDDGQQDWLDSSSLYQLLQAEIAPRFYHRGDASYPATWIAMIKRSMAELVPRFSTARMVREYTSRFYVPASDSFRRVTANGLEKAREALQWRQNVRTKWPAIAICQVDTTAPRISNVGDEYRIRAVVNLDGLSPEDVRVQAIVGQVGAGRELLDTQIYDLDWVAQENGKHVFEVQLRCERPGHRGYALRVVPNHPDVHVPAELSLVCWDMSQA